jgi:hypothetical protein
VGIPTLRHARTDVFFPTVYSFWLHAVVGELRPNRCMGINYRCPIPRTQQVHGHPPQVSHPMHSDLRSPTAYATWEMRCGHLPGIGTYLCLTAGPLCPVLCVHNNPTHVTLSPGTHLVCCATGVRPHAYPVWGHHLRFRSIHIPGIGTTCAPAMVQCGGWLLLAHVTRHKRTIWGRTWCSRPHRCALGHQFRSAPSHTPRSFYATRICTLFLPIPRVGAHPWLGLIPVL